MSRKLKIPVVVIAALALTVVAASAASAASFTASKYPTEFTGLSGKENDKLIVDAVPIYCESVHFTGTTSTSNEAQTVVPTYTKCGNAFYGATIALNGCDYVFTAPALSSSDLLLPR
jgi:nitrous oxidase accessory protein NosD